MVMQSPDKNPKNKNKPYNGLESVTGRPGREEKNQRISEKLSKVFGLISAGAAALSFYHSEPAQQYIADMTGNPISQERLVENNKTANDLLIVALTPLPALMIQTALNTDSIIKEKNRKLKPNHKIVALETEYGTLYMEVPIGSDIRKRPENSDLYWVGLGGSNPISIEKFAINEDLAR